MTYGKYIIKEIRDKEIAILFDPLINHCDIGTIKDSKGEIISAGFFGVKSGPTEKDDEDIFVSVWGESISLKIKSRSGDEKLIKKVLREDWW